MNNQNPSEILNHLTNIADLNVISPFTIGMDDILDIVKTDKLSIATGDIAVSKEEVKKAIDNSDCIVIDSLKYAPLVVEKNKVSKGGTSRPVATCGGLVKNILQRSRSQITIWNALSANGYNYTDIKRYLRYKNMSLVKFLGTLSKSQLIEIYNYVDSHMANRY